MGNGGSRKRLKKFRMCGIVGKGAFGTVVAARDEKEMVALKFQSMSKLLEDKSHAKDAKRELDFLIALQKTNNPFVMKLREAFTTETDLVLVMPLLTGGDVRHHLQEYGFFEIDRVRLLAAELCCGLEAIHSIGLVYRDLKPENVVLTHKGHARITDFDRSRYMETEKDQKLQVFEYTGTPGYMSPELINNERYDQAIDVFGLGILVFEMLHDKLPFDSDVSLQDKVEEKDFPQPKFLPRIPQEGKVLI
mmetsp:Transcript_857/g.1163  ORF Transcript_857/g.1163 Transcript_857/m.1163 type:complete len:249 (+) Transcript_857:37-783(+)|eukprot:CAMPEP_0167768048 /NCGR_PEP_ID=MMETSP0110_2-20121227/16416_1 /TAXON_ID=629695 /ORGANISM="Gymnochlora sp., Strain CCMP2014" /LENGTH=248 /DNA_ID=CAMNT_0007656609 /DNA_START=35 /DNA_END=781 /DNA_ORIENTATION=+